MKHLLYLLLVVVLGACSIADDEEGNLLECVNSVSSTPELLVFEGSYSRDAVFPEWANGSTSDMTEYTFQLVMSGRNMTFDTQLIKMLTGYEGNGDNLVIPYQLVGSSADNQMVVFGLAVPPFEYEVTDAQGYAVRLEFGYGSQAVYNTYTGELTVWLEFAKLYRDGVLYADYTGLKKGFTLLAKRK
jgi:hypothetical protein